jgi:hypothetical protein
LKRFELTGLTIETMYHAFSNHELISQRVLSKWNIVGMDGGEESMNPVGTVPSRA